MSVKSDTKVAELRLMRLAGTQHGVFARAQATKAGMSRSAIARRTGSGAWVRVLPGVYRTPSSPVSWRQKLFAACLWAGKDAKVSHVTAGRLHGLEGLPRSRPGEPIELIVPFGTRLRARGFVFHRSRTLDRADRIEIDGVPVTTFGRTLADLAATHDQTHLAMAIDSGLAGHPEIDVRTVQRAVRRLRAQGRAGTCRLLRLLDERAPKSEKLDSALERRFAAAIRRARLPVPVAHYDVVEGGRHLAEIDFAYPAQRLGIQVNGASVHRRFAVWERDQDQLSDLAAAGWRIVHVTFSQLEARETAVFERIARALGHAER